MSLAELAALKIAPSADDAPPAPERWEDVGLSRELIVDLVLKMLYVHGAQTGQALSDGLCLPFHLVDDMLLSLQQRRMVEVRGTQGQARAAYLFDLGAGGRDRARSALEASQYVGAVPVPLAQYTAWMRHQTVMGVHVSRAEMETALRDVVISPETVERLGPAVNSGKSLFLYGDSGNGKTLVAGAIARMLGGDIHVPHALDLDGETIVVYDPVFHRPPTSAEPDGDGAAEDALWLRDGEAERDHRWVKVRRPVVATGGELTLAQLDLQYDSFTKMYQAPFQVKANGGVLILDDFGRQQMPPQDLLNRWIVPLELRMDFLTLHTGGKFPIPFDCLLIISTNLDPRSLMEEAFLRRIHYKIRMDDPTRAEYEEIFRRCCVGQGIEYSPAGVEFVYDQVYATGTLPRACHPRDVVAHICDSARFLGVPPALTEDLLRRACDSYFLDVTP